MERSTAFNTLANSVHVYNETWCRFSRGLTERLQRPPYQREEEVCVKETTTFEQLSSLTYTRDKIKM